MIKDKYDVIIIGAGVGGLTAASLLAKKGCDVLLIEHHFMPGGCCSAVRRGGVTSDVGASILFGFSEKGLTQHRFVHNCLEEPIDVIRDDSIFRLHWKGKDGKDKEVTIWRDFERFFKELSEAFPGKEAQLRAFYDYLGELYEKLTAVEMPMAFTEIPMSMAADLFSQSESIIKVLNQTGRELMEEFFTDPELIAFFDMIIMTMNTVKSDVNPAILSAMVFADCNRGGAFYPVGSPQMIPNKMEKAFERFGGTILYRHKVVEILFDTKKRKPRACGVRLDNDMEIYAKNIVSNTNIYNFYGGLIKPELCKPGKIEKTMNLQATASVFLTYLSVNAEAIPETARPIEVYISDIANLENMQVRFVFTPSLEDPTLAPEGVHSLTIAQQADPEIWPRPDDPFYQSDDYDGLKEKEADEMLSDLEEFYPGLRKNIRTMEIATPTTLERFTLKYKGNIGGPAQKMGQALFDREHARTKGYKSLYMCGDSTTMGTGVVAACASGVSVANCIIEDQKLGELYLPKKFEKQYINYVGPDVQPLIPLLDPKQPIEMDKDAMRCARECNWCDSDKCRKTCPAGIDVNNFTRRIEIGNFKGGARILREMNPLAEICGYICPAEQLCESECYRLEYKDDPVRIKDLQKWVCEKAGPEGWETYKPEPNGYKVAVVGAGPAGLCCAYFLACLGYKTDVFEKRKKKGGMLTHVIPPSRLPADAIDRDLKGISLPSIDFRYGMELGKDIMVSQLSKEYDAVFIAPGLWSGRKLDLPGIDNINITDALSFIMDYRQKGKVDVEGKLLVIGGGSVAADAVYVASESGVKAITMVCLESREEMPALKTEVDELLECGCELHDSWGPKEFSEGKVTFMECTSVFDKDGKFAPKFNEKNLKEINADTVIVAVGQTVESSLSAYLEKEFGMTGLLEVDPETLQVKGKSKVYAGGDIIRGASTVVQAVADGRRAAMAIHTKLGNNKKISDDD